MKTLEQTKDLILVFPVDTNSVIFDRENPLRTNSFRGDLDDRILSDLYFDRVRNEILEQLPQMHGPRGGFGSSIGHFVLLSSTDRL